MTLHHFMVQFHASMLSMYKVVVPSSLRVVIQ